MSIFYKPFKLHFRKLLDRADIVEREAIDEWLSAIGREPDDLPPLDITARVEVDLDDDFDDDEIAEEYERRFPGAGAWLDRTYRFLAEGDCAAAMEEMQREFGLAPPSHERAIADLLSGSRKPAHVQN